MNINKQINDVLHKKKPEKIPFTIYPHMIPLGSKERLLREKGLGYAWRVPVIDWEHPNCKKETLTYNKDNTEFNKVTWKTPVGEVNAITKLSKEAYNSNWTVEHFIKSEKDYEIVEYINNDAKPVSNYEVYKETKMNLGEDGYVIGNIGYSPLMEIIVRLIGFDKFAFEMADNENKFWSLYECLTKKMKRAYSLVAQSPAELILYGGNVHPEVMGVKRFKNYILPHYNELGKKLHEKDKLLGVHLDADNTILKDAIAESEIDVVEAFTPPPDCALSVREAKKCWLDKILWINFPSSVHMAKKKVIHETTKEIVKEAGSDRVIIGNTENIPADHWFKSLSAITDVLNQES